MKETIYKIPVPTAAEYTKRWRERLDKEHDRKTSDKVKAFTVDVQELNEVIQELGVVKVRFYLGINDLCKETLVLVGVNERNEDLVFLRGSGHAAPDNDQPLDESGTYDFTHPCPSTCADGYSPLMGD